MNRLPDAQDPLYRLLNTKYDADREDEAIEILKEHADLAARRWCGPDEAGQPFVVGSTPLHYAANDGKLRLIEMLIEYGADPNADKARWYATPLAWAANNARISAMKLLMEKGARADRLHALHAAAWGGSSCGKRDPAAYVAAIRLLLDHGADMNDTRRMEPGETPLATAVKCGNKWVVACLRELGAES